MATKKKQTTQTVSESEFQQIVIQAVEDINTVLELDPPIDTAQDYKAIVEELTEIAEEEIAVSDQLAEETWQVLQTLAIGPKKAKKFFTILDADLGVEEETDSKKKSDSKKKKTDSKKKSDSKKKKTDSKKKESAEIEETEKPKADKKKTDSRKKESAKTEKPKKDQKKSDSKEADDKYFVIAGCRIKKDSKNGKFITSISKQPLTMADIKKEDWNDKGTTFYELLKRIKEDERVSVSDDGKISFSEGE